MKPALEMKPAGITANFAAVWMLGRGVLGFGFEAASAEVGKGAEERVL